MIRDNTPILVTGAPRSGTTFLGRMLSLPPYVGYVDEPFNQQTGIVDIRRDFLYIPDDDPSLHDFYDPAIKKLLAGRSTYRASTLPDRDQSQAKQLARGLFTSRTALAYRFQGINPLVTRPLIKDPIASFSAQYLHRRQGMQVVIIMRHPASNVASFKRLGWYFNLRDLTGQPDLMNRYLQPVLGNLDLDKLTDVETWSYFWLATYTALTAFIRDNPGMILVKHESLSRQPLVEFERLYAELHLPFTPAVRKRLLAHTRSGNPVTAPPRVAHALKRDSAQAVLSWKKILTAPEVDTIRQITSPVSDAYYAGADW